MKNLTRQEKKTILALLIAVLFVQTLSGILSYLCQYNLWLTPFPYFFSTVVGIPVAVCVEN
jgi:heme A synthase